MKNMRYFIIFIFVVVAAAIVTGLAVVGSPKEARARRFDDMRVSHLSEIQWQITNFWQSKAKLPSVLNELEDPLRGFKVPLDPETKASYEYKIVNQETLTFELCATFNFESDRENDVSFYGYGYGDQGSWQHSEGRVCFTRTIDKELYPPFSGRPVKY